MKVVFVLMLASSALAIPWRFRHHHHVVTSTSQVDNSSFIINQNTVVANATSMIVPITPTPYPTSIYVPNIPVPIASPIIAPFPIAPNPNPTSLSFNPSPILVANSSVFDTSSSGDFTFPTSDPSNQDTFHNTLIPSSKKVHQFCARFETTRCYTTFKEFCIDNPSFNCFPAFLVVSPNNDNSDCTSDVCQTPVASSNEYDESSSEIPTQTSSFEDFFSDFPIATQTGAGFVSAFDFPTQSSALDGFVSDFPFPTSDQSNPTSISEPIFSVFQL